jgi:hypothetical protein
MMEIPAIPAIDDPEFKEALSALVRSATVMRQIFMMTTAAGIDPKRLAREHGEVIANADRVIDAWCEHLGIEP